MSPAERILKKHLELAPIISAEYEVALGDYEQLIINSEDVSLPFLIQKEMHKDAVIKVLIEVIKDLNSK